MNNSNTWKPLEENCRKGLTQLGLPFQMYIPRYIVELKLQRRIVYYACFSLLLNYGTKLWNSSVEFVTLKINLENLNLRN